jgi:hypothetical protein
MSKRKNPAAVALGRKGGSKNTPAQQAWRTGRKPGAGRKPTYRVQQTGTAQAGTLVLNRRTPTPFGVIDWRHVDAFTPAMLLYLAKWVRATLPNVSIVSIDGGVISYRKV